MEEFLRDAGGRQALGTAAGLLVVGVVMFFRFRKPRALKIERLWVRPAIFLLLSVASLGALPPPATFLNVLLILAAGVIGAAIGWQRGRLMRIEVHPETHDISSSASPLGVIFLLALIAVRGGLRGVATGPGAVPGVSSSAISDALIILAGATMSISNLEMWLRARRLLADAQAFKASSKGLLPAGGPSS